MSTSRNKIFEQLPHDALQVLNSRKNSLLDFLTVNGAKFAAGNMSKPYLGELSPGCKSCVAGLWSCLYVNGLCTTKCFYCPQDRGQKEEREPFVEDNLYIKHPDDYATYLKTFKFNGISFTGGEPFLVFDKVIEFIEMIRRDFGPSHYLWIYTNGDLVTEEKLTSLKKAGLDEIRFDLSARNYDLAPIEMAVNFIDTVTVEIPALVEDLSFLKANISRWAEAGVQHLNLHQLVETEHNRDALASRNYTSIHRELYPRYFPMLESELAALELMKHSVQTNTGLSINYCSKCYKERFQKTASRRRFAPSRMKCHEELTPTFYLREIRLRGDLDTIEDYCNSRALDNAHFDRIVDHAGNIELAVHGRDLPETLKENRLEGISVRYFNVTVSGHDRNKNNAITDIFTDNTILHKDEVYRCFIDEFSEFVMFKALFVERLKVKSAAEKLMDMYSFSHTDKAKTMTKATLFHQKFSNMEWLPVDFLDYT